MLISYNEVKLPIPGTVEFFILSMFCCTYATAQHSKYIVSKLKTC